ncbi:MAG: ribonuclease P protein component [Deltaproteobacteria bacterium]|nr:ribonuclease P protein component [Deltaproteobacteria bacterium]
MAPPAHEQFPKTARLRKRREFLSLSRIGKKVHSAHFVVISKKIAGDQRRLGVTVSSKVGNAVARNRIKRLVRENFRRHQHEILAGTDILVIARSSAKGLAFVEVGAELKRGLAHCWSDRKS